MILRCPLLNSVQIILHVYRTTFMDGTKSGKLTNFYEKNALDIKVNKKQPFNFSIIFSDALFLRFLGLKSKSK